MSDAFYYYDFGEGKGYSGGSSHSKGSNGSLSGKGSDVYCRQYEDSPSGKGIDYFDDI